jgi:hypothetical protein
MARGGRETVTWDKKCGRTGTATYEEAESPPHRSATARSYDSDLVSVSAPFRIERAFGCPSIRCECGEEVA